MNQILFGGIAKAGTPIKLWSRDELYVVIQLLYVKEKFERVIRKTNKSVFGNYMGPGGSIFGSKSLLDTNQKCHHHILLIHF